MFLDDKKVFLAGATGLAGTSILQYLLKNCPKTVVRASYSRMEPFIQDARIEYFKGDLKDQVFCRKAASGCDCAIMAAGSTGGSFINNFQAWKQVNENVLMNTQMLEAFHFEQVKRIIFIGTASVYQEFDGYIKEDALDMNKDPHPAFLGIGYVTRFIEQLCKFWHQKYGMEIVMARSSNIYGPYARFNPETANFIPAIIRKAVDKMDPFEVWGSADVVRDVVYCEDFAEAVVSVLNREKVEFDVFNIGSGIKTTVGNVVAWALEAAGHKPAKIVYDADKPTTIKFRALDISRIKEVIGWSPRHSASEGIRKTTQWWVENKGE